ncbi:glycosyltransferase family 2 protein [Rufibacter tibetensis]|nr:glycosyltransferase [Rufibacter tibetensis]
MIPVYNCSQYLVETIESVLRQEFPADRMQIEVVDDASTDADVEDLVKKVGKGRVQYYRQRSNVGSLRNFETCINRAQGKLVHLLHGDDKVKDGFYAKMESLFHSYPAIGAAFCRYCYIDSEGNYLERPSRERDTDGILDDWLMKIGERQRIQYVAIVVRREVYEELGAFYGVTYGEDWEMWVRIARYYQVAYTPIILAEYRKHISSISGQKILDAQNLRDIMKAMELIQHHLPDMYRKKLYNNSLKFYAHYAIRDANEVWMNQHNKKAVRFLMWETLKVYKDPSLIWKCFKLYSKTLINKYDRMFACIV